MFLAEVPREQASNVAAACEVRCRDAWLEVADAVHVRLSRIIQDHPEFDDLREGWDDLWSQQIGSCFEIRTVVLALNEATKEAIDACLLPATGEVGTSLRMRQLDLVGKLMQAKRSVRHVPSYFPSGSVPQKCTMLGSYEQVGPADLRKSRAFFEQLAEYGEYRGTGTDKREGFCGEPGEAVRLAVFSREQTERGTQCTPFCRYRHDCGGEMARGPYHAQC